MVLHIPFFYVKDKQAFRKEDGALRFLGNPPQIARKLAHEGKKLIHIIDEDAKKGVATNLDIYDSLTYFVNIEVECSENKMMVEKLLAIKSRVVLELSDRSDFSKWKEHMRLLVGIAKTDYSEDAGGVHDVIIENADREKVERYSKLGKRIIVSNTDYRKLDTGPRKLVWGILEPI